MVKRKRFNGDLDQAIEDLEFQVAALSACFRFDWDMSIALDRLYWIAELQEGRNPFDDDTLQELKNLQEILPKR
jgi:hypothetical protein